MLGAQQSTLKLGFLPWLLNAAARSQENVYLTYACLSTLQIVCTTASSRTLRLLSAVPVAYIPQVAFLILFNDFQMVRKRPQLNDDLAHLFGSILDALGEFAARRAHTARVFGLGRRIEAHALSKGVGTLTLAGRACCASREKRSIRRRVERQPAVLGDDPKHYC